MGADVGESVGREEEGYAGDAGDDQVVETGMLLLRPWIYYTYLFLLPFKPYIFFLS